MRLLLGGCDKFAYKLLCMFVPQICSSKTWY